MTGTSNGGPMTEQTHEAPTADDLKKATTSAKTSANGKAQDPPAGEPAEPSPAEAADDTAAKARMAEAAAAIAAAEAREAGRKKAEAATRKEALEKEVARLAGLSREDYEFERKRVAKEYDVRLDYLDERVSGAREKAKAAD